MKQQTITSYSFDELSEEAKGHVLEKMYDINVDHDWWEWTYEDAKCIGLEIDEFDLDRGSYVKGSLTMDMLDSITAILNEHGDSCGTYQLAKDFQKQVKELGRKYKSRGINRQQQEDHADEMYQLRDDFLYALCEEYRVVLQKEYDYQTGEEAIVETIRSNEYQFTVNGDRSFYL